MRCPSCTLIAANTNQAHCTTKSTDDEIWHFVSFEADFEPVPDGESHINNDTWWQSKRKLLLMLDDSRGCFYMRPVLRRSPLPLGRSPPYF